MLRLAISTCIFAVTAACGSIPIRTEPTAAASLPGASSGLLQSSAAALAAQLQPGESAFWLLDRADYSFDARLAMVDEATESLDIQYFIWERDPTSRLFGHRVYQAAERGVRVRILLDDLTLGEQDGEFYALASHPNISVRSFNSFRRRSSLGRVGEFITKFGRLNHRMHNKTMIADGHFAMLGGRNIGDRYFGAWEDFVQNDLDIMTSGPAVDEVAASFDLYWNHSLSYDVADVALPKATEQQLEPTLEFFRSIYLSEQDKLREYPLERVSWQDFFNQHVESFSAGLGALSQDLPDVEVAVPDQMYRPLLDWIATAEKRVLLSTAYLVPDEELLNLFAELEGRGVEVTLLTNSLASNNHMLAHMAYKRWRRKLLRTGVDLFEAREDSEFIDQYTVPPTTPAFLGLHSKAIVIDDRYSFVGSPNIDPRSLIINTEIGFYVESEDLATRLAALIERDISPTAAWRVYFDERGRLRWASDQGVMKNQPALGVTQRVTAFFINLLPLKWQA